MLRTGSFLFLWLALVTASVRAQDTADIPGWELLPDSLMLIWHLDKDQMRRIKVIEEDYRTEREETWGALDLNAQEKTVRLYKLGDARMAEIKGVLGNADYERWQQVLDLEVRGRKEK